MRDPKRIDRVLSVVREIWEKAPDLRLGQIIVGAMLENGLDSTGVFYVEDDELEGSLKIYRDQYFDKRG